MLRAVQSSLWVILALSFTGASLRGAERVEQAWEDTRAETRRNLRDKFHPWTPPATRERWESAADDIREQLLVSTGLWPRPELSPLAPRILAGVRREDYTVEKVIVQTLPGLWLTGNLYRPSGEPTGRRPGILSPHGHWSNGRFYDAGEAAAAKQVEAGAENLAAAARFPLQARMVHLARMGCVVFHYDMIGYADSRLLDHRSGFNDAKSGGWLINHMGLQTLNSIRALDFLQSLPDVDPDRIGVTGASGGGTQTFILGAIDPRPAVAFPAVMVSTNMQGGCVCENAPYLRLGLNNVAFAALFAPKPMALSGADDWTIDIETRGLPELKSVYGLYGQADRVHAKCYPQFGHNYNAVSRKMMYEWFREHLQLKEAAVEERDFEPLTVAEMSVGPEALPPNNPASQQAAREDVWTNLQQQSVQQIQTWIKDPETHADYRRIVGTAARVMLGGPAPKSSDLRMYVADVTRSDQTRSIKGLLGRAGERDAIPFWLELPGEFNGRLVVVVNERAGGEPTDWAPCRQLTQDGYGVATLDVLLAPAAEPSEIPQIDKTYYGYTLGYNRSLIAERVRDIVTFLAMAREHERVRQVHLVGRGKTGIWALLAAGQSGVHLDSLSVDTGEFEFAAIDSVQDPNFLPGAVKYGDLEGLAGLAAPTPLLISRQVRKPLGPGLGLLTRIYQAAEGDLTVSGEPLSDQAVAEHIRQAAQQN